MEKKSQGTEKTDLYSEYKQLTTICNKLNNDIDELTQKIHDNMIDQKLWKQTKKIYKKSDQNDEIVNYFAQKNIIPIIEKLQTQQNLIQHQIQKVFSHCSPHKISHLQQEVDSYYLWLNSSQTQSKISNSQNNRDPQNNANSNMNNLNIDNNNNDHNDVNNLNDNNLNDNNLNDNNMNKENNNSDSSENTIQQLKKQIEDEISKNKLLEKELQEEMNKIQDKHIFDDPAIVSLQQELLSEKQKFDQSKKTFSKLILKQKQEISDHQRQMEEIKHNRLQKFLAEQAALEKATSKPKIYHPTPNQNIASSGKNESHINSNHNINSHNPINNNLLNDDLITNLDVSNENMNKNNLNPSLKTVKKINPKESRLASLIPTAPPASLRIPTPSKDKQQVKKPISKSKIVPMQPSSSESLVMNNQLLDIVNSQLDQLLSDFDE